MKVAIYRNVESGFDAVYQVSAHNQDDFAGYPRVSEIVEVDIPLLPPAEVRSIELEHINKRLSPAENNTVKRLQERREKLLAEVIQ